MQRDSDTVKRKFLENVKFPAIRQVTSYTLLSSKQGIIENTWALEHIPSLAECSSFIRVLTEMKNTMSAVHLKHIGVFGINELKIIKRIHELMKIKKDIDAENVWFEHEAGLPSENCSKVNQEALKKLQSLLLDNSNGRVVVPPGTVTEDVSSLCCNRWISLGLAQAYAKILNSQGSSSRILVLNGVSNITSEQLGNYLQLVNGVDSLEHLLLLINVGRDVKGETYVADMHRKGSHWALLDIDLVAKRYLYCDSLAWPIPSQIEYHLLPVLEALKGICTSNVTLPCRRNQSFLIKAAHVSESVNDVGKHYCTSNCSVNMPLQHCNEICGAVAIMLAAISVLYPALWAALKKLKKPIDEEYGSP